MNREILVSLLALTLTGCKPETSQISQNCEAILTVLGNGQDAGKPQIGRHDDPAWQNPIDTAPATSLGLSLRSTGERFLFDATPDIKAQTYAHDILTDNSGFKLDGVFLTHAHIGHYLGLAQLGREAMGANGVPVYAMPKMQTFLESNGPWNLLVKLGNIDIKSLTHETPVELSAAVSVTPFLVPHREEYSETVGYKITTPERSAIYLPDIDSWDEGVDITDLMGQADLLFIDATFYSGDELPGRDMSKIPHPTISHTMDRLSSLRASDKAKVHFIHMNHTNPVLLPGSEESARVRENGFNVARTGQQHCLK